MKAVFRTDASNSVGTGHVRRCLTLAGALRERGVEVAFICRDHPGNMVSAIACENFPVTVLPAPEEQTDEDCGHWLGVPQGVDSCQTVEALKGARPGWLIVDHYGLDAAWERSLRPHVGRIMVIDDLMNRPHDCDVILNQNYGAEAADQYRDLVPVGCSRLLGPRYALLQPQYTSYAVKHAVREGVVRRILVFFGGVDTENATGLVLKALTDGAFKDIEVDVVVGANNPNRVAIADLATQRPGTRLHEPRQHLADLMASADLAVGAGGTTTWERLCLGLPSLVISIAENQMPACRALARDGLIRYAGALSEVSLSDLVMELRALVADRKALKSLSAQSCLRVDGRGALRVAERLAPTPAEELRLRPACMADSVIYFDWANEPEVRRQSIHQAVIPWSGHQKWFASKLADPNCHMFVLEAGTLPIGQIRFDVMQGAARINYSLDQMARGRGWGGLLVTMSLPLIHSMGAVCARAEVKVTNSKSAAVFRRLGFEEQPNSDGELVEFRLAFG